MKQWIIATLLTLTACASGSKVLTMDSYYDIPIGATQEEVVAKAGDPWKITHKEDGTEEYLYVERMSAGARLLQERRYIITIKNGTVVSKHVEQSSPSPTSTDSYDMQTTRNAETSND